MMILSHKFAIFVVFITLHHVLVETQNHRYPDVLDRNHGYPWVFKPVNVSTTQQIQTYTVKPIYEVKQIDEERPTIKPSSCVHHSHVFSFSNVGLQKIGRDFIISNDIISLSLDNNDINDISPFAFRNMQNLQYLDLSGNKIPKEKLLSLAGNAKLQVLIIDNNRDSHKPVTNILKEFEVFSNLKELHLCNSQLGNFQIPFYITTPILTHLYLTNNNISSSDVVFNNIPAGLTHLYLNKNSIDRVKQGKLRDLEKLVMDDNVITQVCFEDCEEESISLKGAVKLQNLSLSNNLISEISPDAFSDTRRLLILDLSGNKISDVAKGTFNNTNIITNLSLANNMLVTVPDVCSVYYLKTLDLSRNRLSAILSGIFCTSLTTLEYLYLSNNVITTVETHAFYSLRRLKYLDLSGNRLRQLPENWGHPLFIQELHLERNNFTELDNISLVNMKDLKNVYLDENPMPIMKAESFHSLPGFLTIHLKNMRVENDCAQCKCNNIDYDDEDDNGDDNGDDDN